jgi:hypothetical protein
MAIALGADAFFWVVGEIDCSCSLGAAVFRLFGYTAVCRTMASAAVMAITKWMNSRAALAGEPSARGERCRPTGFRVTA